ncbi:MAG: glycosyltransferase family 9 protein [Verrucomicrobiota bacterium]
MTRQDASIPEKWLFLELWGLGDAILMSSALRAAIDSGKSVTVVTKPATIALLSPAFPQVSWIEWTAPWTAFRGKYHLWRWDWKSLLKVISGLRQQKFECGFSPRRDPRDHLLLSLAGVRKRYSFRHSWSAAFLNQAIDWSETPRHRWEDWNALIEHAGLTSNESQPSLPGDAYCKAIPTQLAELPRPWIVLHTGAGKPARLWPEASWRTVVEALRQNFNFSLIVIPDPIGHGKSLDGIADAFLDNLSVQALAATLAQADAMLGHDSGPAHLAAAVDTPVFAVFGPTEPRWFRPLHPDATIVHDPQCPFFPCRDYCRFEEPQCMTRLSPDRIRASLVPWLKKNLPDCTITERDSSENG